MQVRKEAPRKLRGQMLVLGISQRQLAEQIGHSAHSYVGRLVRGEIHSVDPSTAVAIAAALHMPVDALFLPRVSTSSVHDIQPEGTAA